MKIAPCREELNAYNPGSWIPSDVYMRVIPFLHDDVYDSTLLTVLNVGEIENMFFHEIFK